MVGVKGYDAAILETLKRHRVQIVAKTSNASTITHFLRGSAKAVKRVEQDLNERFPSAAIASRKVALIAILGRDLRLPALGRSEEHTSELQSLMRISYAVFCLKKTTYN